MNWLIVGIFIICTILFVFLKGHINRTERVREDLLNNHQLTQFQLECERLLIERVTQTGSSITNRTLGFVHWTQAYLGKVSESEAIRWMDILHGK